ncbi:serine hydrolase domain-containing protein [Streptomyces zagrosensis]|uniref:CubicO group peptidase (Beta-lactamase class C family) n=1 Tax=Streptomyces zagrosensis TaxID=1042984 RepID=A0A7W9QDM9_9ACTN|nr:serine hydrolase domain-containing protein [Streptomyces zagrosensis]MBB5938335.1 CubicO group peptidase (beta-lactamase class C family) [Streptomyces zagrosensis]
MDVQGAVAPGFEPVRDAFAANFAQRGEQGAAVALYRDGRKIVDIWGGTRDAYAPADQGLPTQQGHLAERSGAEQSGAEPWAAGTAQVLHSATKGLSAAVPLLLHQRGLVDLDAPVGTYWPEFKANGKERVLVRHLLSHRAGLPVIDAPLSPAEAIDGVSGPRALAAQAPQWVPGTEHGYHARTYGWLLGELVRRITGRTIGTWVADEIARPLGLDLWIGLPDAERERVGRLAPIQAPEPSVTPGLRVRAKQTVTDAYQDPRSLTRRAFGAIDPLPDQNAPVFRAAELPASGGIATARALARCYAAMLGDVAPDAGYGLVQGAGRDVVGEAGRGPDAEAGSAGGALPGGRRLFAPATLTLARTEESAGPDRVLVVHTRFGLGYMLHGSASPLLAQGSFGHPGSGGSLAFADPESGIAFGYVTNGMQKNVTADPRAQALVRAVQRSLA